MTRSRGPSLEAALAEAPSTQTAKCPNCGGALRFDTDKMGYGTTLEQCENVMKCGYWRTFGQRILPAHRPAPRGEERPRRRRVPAERSVPGEGRVKREYHRSFAVGGLQERILAAVPTAKSDAEGERVAVDTDVILAAVGGNVNSTKVRLTQLARDGALKRIKGPARLDPSRWWRAA